MNGDGLFDVALGEAGGAVLFFVNSGTASKFDFDFGTASLTVETAPGDDEEKKGPPGPGDGQCPGNPEKTRGFRTLEASISVGFQSIRLLLGPLIISA